MRPMTGPHSPAAIHRPDLTGARASSHAVVLASGEPPADVQLLPLGTFAGRDGRGPYQIPDPDALVAFSQAVAGARDLPIDYGHEMELQFHDARAAGWITQLEVRPDGIYGRVEWTQKGAQAVREREYRYLSPVFYHAPDGTVLYLARVALTNNPNLDLKALNSRSTQFPFSQESAPVKSLLERLREHFKLDAAATDDAVVARCSALQTAETTLQAMATALGVAVTATAEQFTAALAPLQAAHTAQGAPDPSKFVPMAVHQETVTALAAAQASGKTAAGEAAIAAAMSAGKVTPAQKDWALAYHARDPQGFATYIAKAPVLVAPQSAAGAGAPTAGAPAGGTPTLDESAKAVCSQLGISAEQFATTAKQEL